MTISVTSTRDMTRDAWLEARRSGIGGSDAAALVGMNPWATPWTVWADKMGIAAEKEETEAIRLGRDLEPYVAERFTEASALQVRRVNAILRNPAYPVALANIDRRIVGESAGLECKTTSAWHTKEYRGGTFPDRFYAQCVHYLAVTGWDRWYLAALVLGEGLHIYQMVRNPDEPTPTWCEGSVYVDDQEIDSLMLAEAGFWEKYVAAKTPPPVDGDPSTTKAIQTARGEPQDEDVLLDLADGVTIKSYIDLRAQKQALEREMERCKQSILLSLGTASKGHTGSYSVSCDTSTRRSLDTKLLHDTFPTLNLDPFYKVSTSQRFTVKERKA